MTNQLFSQGVSNQRGRGELGQKYFQGLQSCYCPLSLAPKGFQTFSEYSNMKEKVTMLPLSTRHYPHDKSVWLCSLTCSSVALSTEGIDSRISLKWVDLLWRGMIQIMTMQNLCKNFQYNYLKSKHFTYWLPKKLEHLTTTLRYLNLKTFLNTFFNWNSSFTNSS